MGSSAGFSLGSSLGVSAGSWPGSELGSCAGATGVAVACRVNMLGITAVTPNMPTTSVV